jgi:hypothetical protein
VEEIMRTSKTMPAIIFLGLLTSGALPSAHAAPLPTNIAAMKSMSSGNVVQARWGGWRGGWGYRGYRGGGWGYGRRGYGGWGYGGWGLGAAAAGAIVGGAIASSAYYGGYPYYDDSYAYDNGYAYDSCPPAYGYGGYSAPYHAYPYRGYYSGW